MKRVFKRFSVGDMAAEASTREVTVEADTAGHENEVANVVADPTNAPLPPFTEDNYTPGQRVACFWPGCSCERDGLWKLYAHMLRMHTGMQVPRQWKNTWFHWQVCNERAEMRNALQQ